MNDIRFSLQGRYVSVLDLSAFGITNNAVTIHGFALHAGDGISEGGFIKTSRDQIATTLRDYLNNRGLVRGRNNLFILDMEPSYTHPDPNDPTKQITTHFPPRALGRYNDNPELQEKLIKAYALRTLVAREVLQETLPEGNFSTGFYGVIVPMGKGEVDDDFEIRLEGYRRAQDLRMYDFVDCLVPVLYNRFGRRDVPLDNGNKKFDLEKLHDWIEQSTRQAITVSQRLLRSNGEAVPLAPILTFWVANGNSEDDRKAVLPKTMSLQLRVLRDYPSVEMVVLWSGPETAREMRDSDRQVINFKQFLNKVEGLLSYPRAQ